MDGIVAAGRHLADAKEDLAKQHGGSSHGHWLPMLEQIGINDQVARQLMRIGGNDAITNPSNCLNLPKSERALYELSRCDPPALEAAIQSGRITPQTTIKEAKERRAGNLFTHRFPAL